MVSRLSYFGIDLHGFSKCFMRGHVRSATDYHQLAISFFGKDLGWYDFEKKRKNMILVVIEPLHITAFVCFPDS